MAEKDDDSPPLDLICLMSVWDALIGSQRHGFTYLSGRRGIRAQASHILSASSSATTSFFHEESRHLTLMYGTTRNYKLVHFKKVTTWLKLKLLLNHTSLLRRDCRLVRILNIQKRAQIYLVTREAGNLLFIKTQISHWE